jgi:phage terminase large subunit-like protein
MAATTTSPSDWRDWPEERKRLLRARLLERRHKPWRETARPEQLPPVGDWYIWFLVGGRGAGKTRSGAEWLAEELRGDGPGDESAILAPTFGDARDRCVEGPSGLLRALGTSRAEVEAGRSWTVERWNRSMGELRLRSGAVVHIDGADDGALRIQGGNLRRAWCDELRLWKQAEQAWDESLLPAVRLGRPHIVVTSTPKPTPLVKRLLRDPGVIKSHMTTFENEDNLAPAFLEQMRSRYGGTRLGQQELLGRLLEEVEGALWKQSDIDRLRVEHGPYPGWQAMPVVGVDPADGTADGAEHGLAVVAHGMDNDLYLIASKGYRLTPAAFAREAIAIAREHGARIVIEKNHGGAWLEAVFRGEMRDMNLLVPLKLITASQNKRTRAEPAAALTEQGRVHHIGEHPELEEQLTSFTGAPGEASPDRLDAYVHAMSEFVGRSLQPSDSGPAVVPYGDGNGSGVVRWQ